MTWTKTDKEELEMYLRFTIVAFIIIGAFYSLYHISQYPSQSGDSNNIKIVEMNYYDNPDSFCEFYNGTYGVKETWASYGSCVFDVKEYFNDVYKLRDRGCMIDKRDGRWYFMETCEVLE